MKKEKLWAMPDEGHCDGDSAFYYPPSLIPYKEGQTYKNLIPVLAKRFEHDFGDDAESALDMAKEAKVFSVITDGTRKLINAGLPRGSCGDSETYMINRSCKQMCREAALKILRRKK